MKKLLSILLCAALLSCSACGAAAEPQASITPASPSAYAAGSSEQAQLSYINDYTVLLKTLAESDRHYGGMMYAEADSGMAAAESPAESVPAPGAQNDIPSDYSGTNVQVEGVDEGDIVKTDGKVIYIISGYELRIYSAAGPDTALLASLTVGYDKSADSSGSWSYEGKSPTELYISGDRLAVVSSYYSAKNYEDAAGAWQYDSEGYLVIDVYDVSNPSVPALIATQGQDGSLAASRLIDGTLYAVTNYYVYDYDEGDPRTYVPCVYKNGSKELIPEDCVSIMPQPSGAAYAVICAYELESGAMTENLTVLGAGNTVYMNGGSLYLADYGGDLKESQPRTESVYTVVDYSYRSVTDICRFTVAEGKITAGAVARVEGAIDSQFSLDEYNGSLRVVTSVSGYDYSVYTDAERGFENYKYADDFESSASLYVLDAETMTERGSITGLAPGEYVYSVRFDGDWAYFCTYETMDPLFAVDVSDPAGPRVLSELKISGFSEYLHVWSDGLLFGLGQETVERTEGDSTLMTTDGMKLVMFDISDKAAVTAESVLEVDADWSEALYNHKAILIDSEKNLIGFPAGSGYDIYGWTQSQGFFLRARIETASDWGAGIRGLYAGDYVYVIDGDGITVVNLSSFILSAKVPF